MDIPSDRGTPRRRLSPSIGLVSLLQPGTTTSHRSSLILGFAQLADGTGAGPRQKSSEGARTNAHGQAGGNGGCSRLARLGAWRADDRARRARREPAAQRGGTTGSGRSSERRSLATAAAGHRVRELALLLLSCRASRLMDARPRSVDRGTHAKRGACTQKRHSSRRADGLFVASRRRLESEQAVLCAAQHARCAPACAAASSRPRSTYAAARAEPRAARDTSAAVADVRAESTAAKAAPKKLRVCALMPRRPAGRRRSRRARRVNDDRRAPSALAAAKPAAAKHRRAAGG